MTSSVYVVSAEDFQEPPKHLSAFAYPGLLTSGPLLLLALPDFTEQSAAFLFFGLLV